MMIKIQLNFRICILIISVFGLSLCQNECPPNEMPAECEDTCTNRCDSYGQMCSLECIPGCQCLPGYTRDSYMNCIPRQFCPGNNRPRDTSSEDVKRILEWEDNKKGCPDETRCRANCKLGGMSFRDGLCTGPNRKHCLCYTCRNSAPYGSPPSNNLCPNLVQCITSCQNKGFSDGGQCIGPGREKCECFSDLSRAEDSLLSPNTVRGGCPILSQCTAFCNGRGFRSGICLGPKKEYCNCFSKVSGPGTGALPGGIDPSGGLPPNGGLPKPGMMPPKPGFGKPPGNNGDPQTGGMGCPDLAKCVTGCTKSGKASGFCSGEGRRTCTCL